MKEFRIEFTEKENTHGYVGEWYTEIVSAETEDEAIELLRQYFVENEVDSYMYIYRVR